MESVILPNIILLNFHIYDFCVDNQSLFCITQSDNLDYIIAEYSLQ